jgi:hypothetical protein
LWNWGGNWVISGFSWVITGLLLGFPGFSWVIAGFCWVLLGFPGSGWVLLGPVGLYPLLPAIPTNYIKVVYLLLIS